jgi:acid phosphatase family membrane protein YuiD
MISLVLPLAFTAWALAQGIKYFLTKRVDPTAKFSDPGGMPSSHSSTVAAGVVVVGIETGFGSTLFGLSMILLAVVVHDAYRLRWSVGEQALRLNALLAKDDPQSVPLVVWKGHRQQEVAAGLALGAAVGSLAWLL